MREGNRQRYIITIFHCSWFTFQNDAPYACYQGKTHKKSNCVMNIGNFIFARKNFTKNWLITYMKLITIPIEHSTYKNLHFSTNPNFHLHFTGFIIKWSTMTLKDVRYIYLRYVKSSTYLIWLLLQKSWQSCEALSFKVATTAALLGMTVWWLH